MTVYIIKRLTMVIPIFLLISILTFSLSQVSAGDAARVLAEKVYGRPTPEQIEQIRVANGLDKPLAMQYFSWLSQVLKGDFGNSYQTGRPVMREVAVRLPVSMRLTILSIFILLVVTIPLGVLSALYPDSIIDKFSRSISYASASMPDFWMGLLLLYFFGVKMKIISVLGSNGERWLLIPAITLSFGHIGVLIRLMCSSMKEVLKAQYIRALYAKGIPEWKVIFVHGLKNAILPMVTQMGMVCTGLVCGSAVVESIFSIQGIGRYMLEAVFSKDMPVLQALIIMVAGFVVTINLVIDIFYCLVDKRVSAYFKGKSYEA